MLLFIEFHFYVNDLKGCNQESDHLSCLEPSVALDEERDIEENFPDELFMMLFSWFNPIVCRLC